MLQRNKYAMVQVAALLAGFVGCRRRKPRRCIRACFHRDVLQMLANLLTFPMGFQVEYFHERVLAEIESWPVDVLADYARLVELLAEHGPSLRLPHSRAFGEGLFELRPRGRAGIGRAFYCFLVGKRVVVLHAFIKKTQQTPDSELKTARKRLKEVQHG
jgi:phage-related protein